MKHNLKDFWYRFGGWFLLLGVPLAVVVIDFTAQQAHSDYVSLPRTEVAPPGESEVTFDMETNKAYTAEDGVAVIPGSPQPKMSQAKPVGHLPDSAQTGANQTFPSTPTYTLPEDAALPDGSMGILTIPKLDLSAPVYKTEEGGEMESMTKGVAYFAITSAWAGNIGLCSHNVAPARAVAYFRDIHKLEKGDVIQYKTALGKRDYEVSEVKDITEDDWSPLSRTEDGRLTLHLHHRQGEYALNGAGFGGLIGAKSQEKFAKVKKN